MKRIILNVLFTFWGLVSYAQNIEVDVNLNVMHSQEGESTFDREKYIGVHAGIRENDWTQYGASDPVDIKNDLLNNRDVYLGRNTGTITWNINSVLREDPNRPGFVDLNHLRSEAKKYRDAFGNRADFVNYLGRNNSSILATQAHPFYPDGTLTNKGWSFSQKDTENEPFGTASGEYIAHFIKEFYGNGSEQTPQYFEVINEPIYGLYGCEDCGETDEDIEAIFRYHNAVAHEVKKVNPNLLVGGYTSAFPNFDYDNFQRWEKRWNKFMDMCGENMDFWSVHLYDWPEIRNKRLMRKGSRVEATLDMLEHASMDKFGEVKPILISEYGSQVHTLITSTWSKERDWHLLRSYITLGMQFMDRSQHIAKAWPFIVLKATWGTQPNGNPYNTRLLRKEGEPNSSNGDWVYTELIKFYDFWEDVNGTRVDIRSNNVDIQTLATVDGNRLFVVLNNLNRNAETIDLNINGYEGNALNQVKIKHLYGNNGLPVLDENIYNSAPNQVTLLSESAMVIEYTFQNDVEVDETSNETKYYANKYYLPISGNEETFQFSGLNLSQYGEAIVRIGMGRDHDLSKNPIVKVNGSLVQVPNNVKGELQEDRDAFFGVLEIPVPYHLLNANTTVTVQFPDNGGHISSVNMRVYNFSTEINRSFESNLNNKITIADHPNNILSGDNFTVQVNYESATQNDIVALINNPSGTWLTSTRKTIEKGIGTTTLTLPINENWTVDNGYVVGVSIRPVEGGFDSNYEYKTSNFNITDAVNLNTVAFDQAPTSVESGQDVKVNVAYEAAEQLDIVAIVNSPEGYWLANKTTRVNAGTGTVELSITPTTEWSLGSNYKLGICIRPKGGDFASNLDYQSTFFEVTSPNNRYSLQNQGSFKYVTSENAEKLQTTSSNVGDFETFELIENEDGTVSFKGNNGLFVSSENGSKELTCTRENIGNWEKFTLEDFGNEIYALKGNNDLYVRNNMLCTSQEATAWQKFKLTKVPISSSSARIITLEKELVELNIYPNPTDKNLTIHWGHLIQEATLLIYDIQGQMMKSYQFDQQLTQEKEIDISDLEKGIYILKFNVDGETINKKIVKQ